MIQNTKIIVAYNIIASWFQHKGTSANYVVARGVGGGCPPEKPYVVEGVPLSTTFGGEGEGGGVEIDIF